MALREFNEQQHLESSPILRTFQLPDKRTVVFLRSDQGDIPSSWYVLQPQERLIQSTISDETSTWFKKRTGVELPSGDSHMFIYDDKQGSIRTITTSTQPLDATTLGLAASIYGTTVAKEGHNVDTPVLIAQKRGKEPILATLTAAEIKQGHAAKIGKVEDETLYLVATTDEMSAESKIDGDPASADFKTPKPLLKTGGLIVVKVGNNGAVTFGKEGWGKAPTTNPNDLGAFQVGSTTLKERLESATFPGVTKEPDRRRQLERVRAHLIKHLMTDANYTYPHDAYAPPTRAELTQIHQRAIPSSLAHYLESLHPELRSAERARQAEKPLEIRGLPEDIVETYLSKPETERADFLADYVVLETQIPREIEELTRRAGFSALGETAQSVLGEIYQEQFLEWGRLTQQEVDERISQEPNDAIRQRLSKLASTTRRNSNVHSAGREIARYLAAYRFDEKLMEVGLEYFSNVNQINSTSWVKIPEAFALTIYEQVENSLELATAQVEIANLGSIALRTDVKTTEGPFHYAPEYRTTYPEVVKRALARLYQEYNEAFRPLVEANREWPTDYQYALTSDGTPINRWVQIDMTGLSAEFLQATTHMSEEDVTEALRGKIFELENSLAMYQLLEKIFSSETHDSSFNVGFRASLDQLREQHGKKVALLAVTEGKYNGMKTSEFGKQVEEPLTDEEVRELSGFDRFFSPDEFRRYIEEQKAKGEECEYLLYVRSSDPLAKLKDPSVSVDNPLLADDAMRRVIKANAITFNIDNPRWPLGDPRRINDTKAYLPTIGMAHPVYASSDIQSPELVAFLQARGVDPTRIASGEVALRAKPMQSSYGCYGHESGNYANSAFVHKLGKNLSQRGPYVIQPEMSPFIIQDQEDGETYVTIDRNFMAIGANGEAIFLGGFRSMMPRDSREARRGRVHGSDFTVWAEIL